MTRTIHRFLTAAVVAAGTAGILGTPQHAAAQQYYGEDATRSQLLRQPLSREGVLYRWRPEYAPLGIRMRSFMLYPSLETGVGYDDNVFEDEVVREGDGFFHVTPRARLVSDWSRHALAVDVRSRSEFFFDLSENNTTDVGSLISGRLDIGGQSALRVFGNFDKLNEDRGEPDTIFAAVEPTPYLRYGGGARIDSRLNRLTYGVGLQYERFDYDSVDVLDSDLDDAGTIDTDLDGDPLFDETFDNDDRDFDIVTAVAEVGFDFSPGYLAFVRGSANRREFDLEEDRNLVDRNGDGDVTDAVDSGLDRDSQGWEVTAGMRFELTNLLAGEVSAGYLQQNFDDDPALDDVSGIALEANLEWYPSPLLTAQFRIRRNVTDTIVAGASGRFDTRLGAGLDYEFRRNIILSGDVDYLNSNFEGADRTDNVISATFAGQYLINRRLRAVARYRITNRKSDFPGEDYLQNVVSLNLRMQI